MNGSHPRSPCSRPWQRYSRSSPEVYWRDRELQLIKIIFRIISFLLYSTQTAFNFDIAETNAAINAENESKNICLMAAHNILCLIRKYRQQHGIRHAPIILIYSLCQAMRTLRTFGSVQEECDYMYGLLSECSGVWGLAAQALVHISQVHCGPVT